MRCGYGFSWVRVKKIPMGYPHRSLFSPVVWFESMCLMPALAALHNRYMTGVDLCTAYLYRKPDEEI